MELIGILQLIICLVTPLIMMRLSRLLKLEDWLSPVVLSYLFGIFLANTPIFPINEPLATNTMGVTIFLALPLLLFATQLSAFFKNGRSIVWSFFLCVFSGVFCTLVFSWVFRNIGEDTSVIGGMLVGLYTGGNPNMATLSLALGARDGLYIIISTIDLVWSGLYLIILTSILKPLLSLFLKPYASPIEEDSEETAVYSSTAGYSSSKKLKNWSLALGLSVMVAGGALGLTFLFTGGIEDMGVIILLLTSLSLLASFIPSIRTLPGSYELGEYILFVFCVAAGLLADFSELKGVGLSLGIMVGLTMYATITLHFLLSRLFRIDVDTAIITSTAAIFGPIFIGQVGSAIKNRNLIFPGIVAGLAGMGLGNYLGIIVAKIIASLI